MPSVPSIPNKVTRLYKVNILHTLDDEDELANDPELDEEIRGSMICTHTYYEQQEEEMDVASQMALHMTSKMKHTTIPSVS